MRKAASSSSVAPMASGAKATSRSFARATPSRSSVIGRRLSLRSARASTSLLSLLVLRGVLRIEDAQEQVEQHVDEQVANSDAIEVFVREPLDAHGLDHPDPSADRDAAHRTLAQDGADGRAREELVDDARAHFLEHRRDFGIRADAAAHER